MVHHSVTAVGKTYYFTYLKLAIDAQVFASKQYSELVLGQFQELLLLADVREVVLYVGEGGRSHLCTVVSLCKPAHYKRINKPRCVKSSPPFLTFEGGTFLY